MWLGLGRWKVEMMFLVVELAPAASYRKYFGQSIASIWVSLCCVVLRTVCFEYNGVRSSHIARGCYGLLPRLLRLLLLLRCRWWYRD